jgi:hypothetical protein
MNDILSTLEKNKRTAFIVLAVAGMAFEYFSRSIGR